MSDSARYPWFCKGDLDGFFGLFIDNLVQLLLIVNLCALCGITSDSELLLGYILPGAGISILLGNIFYAWQAHRLAKAEDRSDVTALPYGINTPSLLVYIYFVMLPVYKATDNPEIAWKMGVIACLGSGLIELAGSFVAERLRKHTPRAALLSTLAGIAIGFISMKFALEIFQRPLIAMVPLAIILLTYFGRVRFPAGLPGGLVAILVGTACAWVLPLITPYGLVATTVNAESVQQSWELRGFYPPTFALVTIGDILREPIQWLGFLSIIIPMGLFNLLGSLQNIESAEAAGDSYSTTHSLAANGIGTIAAALFGSCFPTTIYIGHPGWKGLGARAGYSTLNGIVITAVCFTGTVGVIGNIVPIEAGVAIVLWIGIVITAQAFQAVPPKHAAAVAIGLFPAIAAWGFTVAQGAFFASGGPTTIQRLIAENNAFEVSGFLLHGLITLERGYIFTCMILAAVVAVLIDGKFYQAAIWMAVAAGLTLLGLMHAYQVLGNEVDFLLIISKSRERAFAFRGIALVIGYLLAAGTFAFVGWKEPMFRGESKPAPKAAGKGGEK